MNHSESMNVAAVIPAPAEPRMLCATVALTVAFALTACGGDKAAKGGQALASVNGEEVTSLQLNEELQRSGISPEQAQQPAVVKQLLDGLIDRQLLVNQAMQDHTDRDPQVVRAIERTKAMLIAQAYIQKKIGTLAKPTTSEVEEYYRGHPGFFSGRKIFDMRQLMIATSDIDGDLKAFIDSAKTIDDVAAYMDEHKIKFARNQLQRSSADLPPELSKRLLAMNKGQLFLVKEGTRSVLGVLTDIKDAPVSLEVATPQIEQFLFSNKNKEAANAELVRLRASAKIEYLNKAAPAAPAAPAASASASAAASASSATDANARGVAGLK